ncbi:hypothetical protein E2C01_057790 [Portunus trituberculatus]|uniref:Uncharacterized protein n=1 Tax=Portunus trituberculatus TaxID=210409 RepID=A0A5B7H3K6_PORTR|nr:hypothetical protein [Portunus trituberculatus]
MMFSVPYRAPPISRLHDDEGRGARVPGGCDGNSRDFDGARVKRAEEGVEKTSPGRLGGATLAPLRQRVDGSF